MSPKTFEAATAITRYFVTEQLEVLQFVRVDKMDKTHSRLQELFLRNNNEPITMRALTRSHKLAKSDIILCVKTYPHIYGMLTQKSDHGGEPSVVVYLQKSRNPKNVSNTA